MGKLLIADRDINERIGINWLVSSYPIPFQQVFTATSVQESIALIEREVPDVLCVEIDMIPKEDWEHFKKTVKLYVKKIIVMTAEAVFERAMQAIEIHGVDLWLKPISPDQIKRTLLQCYQDTLQEKKEAKDRIHLQLDDTTYRSLFIDEDQNKQPSSLVLIQPENKSQVKNLVSIQQTRINR